MNTYIKYIILLVVFGFMADYARAYVVCGNNVSFGIDVFPCGKEITEIPTTTTTTTTTTTSIVSSTSTISTTTTLKKVLPPSIYHTKTSKARNMSYIRGNQTISEYCDPIFCGFFGWFGRILS